MKSHCNIAPPSIYPEQRTVKRSGNTYQINATLCPRWFVKSTASLCLNKYSLAEREYKKGREGNWGGKDQVTRCCSSRHSVICTKNKDCKCLRHLPSSIPVINLGVGAAALEVVSRMWRISSLPLYWLTPEAMYPGHYTLATAGAACPTSSAILAVNSSGSTGAERAGAASSALTQLQECSNGAHPSILQPVPSPLSGLPIQAASVRNTGQHLKPPWMTLDQTPIGTHKHRCNQQLGHG